MPDTWDSNKERPLDFDSTPNEPTLEEPIPPDDPGPEDLPETSTELSPGPPLPSWENVDDLGIGIAVIQSVREVFSEPSLTFRRMPKEGPGIVRPLILLLLLGAASSIVLAFYELLRTTFLPESTTYIEEAFGYFGLSAPPLFQSPALSSSCIAVGRPISMVISAFITAGLSHLVLVLLNASRYPFATTFRTLAYVRAVTSVLVVIPYIGGILAIVFQLAYSMIAISKTQETSPGVAAAAILVPILFCCFCVAIVLLPFVVTQFLLQNLQ